MKNTAKIGWIEIDSRQYGGVVYEDELEKILKNNFNLKLIGVSSKYFKKGYLRGGELLLRLLRLEGKSDLWIRNGHTILSLRLDKTKGEDLALIHHIDSAVTPFPFRIIDEMLDKLTYWNLRRAKAIITVSQYWKDHFLKKGYKNVYTIYNPFNLSEYNIKDEEAESFKKGNSLEGKPIIYLGNCQAAKGVIESYEALKSLNAHLVTAGEQFVKIPARNFCVSHRDYLKLLKASDIVISMSRFKEGWSRTTHEAMLLKRPVIGSGQGGMKELLEGGGQIVCPEFSLLKGKIESLLEDPQKRKEMGERGYEFAKDFSQERFEKEWLGLVGNLLKE